ERQAACDGRYRVGDAAEHRHVIRRGTNQPRELAARLLHFAYPGLPGHPFAEQRLLIALQRLPYIKGERPLRAVAQVYRMGQNWEPGSVRLGPQGGLSHRGCHEGVMASTRTGLPLPATIFSGAAITTAPVAGSLSRLQRLARPNLPAPCMVAWFGKGGSKVPAWPASVPTVSTPTPKMSRSLASSSDAERWKPGVCGPCSSALKKSAPARVLHPVCTSTQAPAGMRPWRLSQARMCSGSRRKSGSAAHSPVTLNTQAGPMKRPTGIVSQA